MTEFLYATSKDAVDKPLTSSFKLMTVFTISWCLINIVFQPWMTPQGGAAFYMMLLIVYGAILIIILSVSFYIRKTSLKGK